VELGEVGRGFDLTARLEASGETGLRLITAADGWEYLDMRLDPATGDLVVDRDRASRDSRARGGSYRMPCHRSRNGVGGTGLRLAPAVRAGILDFASAREAAA
jgi:beta-fructofuranosidase